MYNPKTDRYLAKAAAQSLAWRHGALPEVYGYVRGSGQFVDVYDQPERIIDHISNCDIRKRVDEILKSKQRKAFLDDVDHAFRRFRST